MLCFCFNLINTRFSIGCVLLLIQCWFVAETEDSERSIGSEDERSGWRQPFGSDYQKPQRQKQGQGCLTQGKQVLFSF